MQFSHGQFDRVVLSEVGYYWPADDLVKAVDKINAALLADAWLLLVHWTAPVADYPLDGDAVHEHFMEHVGRGRLRHAHGQRHPQYRLDLFARLACD